MVADSAVKYASDQPSLASSPDYAQSYKAPVMVGLLAAGLCLLAVWLIRRLARPGKLSLANTPDRHNTLNPGHIVLVIALLLAGSGGLKALLDNTQLDAQKVDILVALGGQLTWLVGGLLVGALCFRHGLSRGMGLSLRRWFTDTTRGLWAFLAIMPIWVGLYWLTLWLAESFKIPIRAHQILKLVQQSPGGWRVLTVVTAVVVAPLAEEIFARGLMQSMIRRYTQRPWLAIVVTSVVFALLHMEFWYSMPALAALAVAIGYNYERTGRLLAPIIIHALFNCVNIWLYVAYAD